MPTDTNADSIVTRHSLLRRIKNPKDQQSWSEFFEIYRRLIHAVAMKSGLNNEEAEEVVQETMLSVSKSIGDFKTGRQHGSFKAWLLKLTRWRIVDQLRKRKPTDAARRKPSDDGTSTLERLPDSDSGELDRLWEAEWATHLLNSALDRVKASVRPKAYQAYQLCTLEDLPAADVAKQLGVSKVNVHVMVHRVNRVVRKEIRALEKLP